MHGTLAERAVVARASVEGAWLRCTAVYSGVQQCTAVSCGDVGGSRLSDVEITCRTSRRRRGRCDGALTKLTVVVEAPVPAGV